MESEQTCTDVDAANEKQSDVFIEIEIPFTLYQYLCSENFDIQKLCRICLAIDSKAMFPLVTSKETNILTDMFTAVTSIQVNNEDGLPSQICTNCQALIVQCYDLKVQCEKADYTLKSMLRGEFTVKQEVISDSSVLNEENKLFDVEPIIKEELEMSESTNLCIQHSGYANNDGKPNEKEAFYLINNTSNETKNVEVSITDSNTLLSQIIKEKGKKKTKERRIYKCSSCTKKFLKLNQLKEHRKLEHGAESQLHSCDLCRDLFNSQHDLQLHMSLHSKGSVWKCSKCDKQFNGKNELRRHIQRHMESKKYSCDSCDKRFVELYALRRHVRVHTGEMVEKKHACHLCEKRYTEHNALVNHLKRHSGARPCVCASCGKAFPNKRLLASHSLVHSDKKPYGCGYCDKRFRHESTRNAHQRLHTGEKPYVCSVCGKTFVQASNLTLHMRTHTGERPYTCTVCGRKFTSGSSLKNHSRTHTGERPFACNICGKSFARQNLRAHMRQHSGDRPHACSVCDKKFINAAKLREHVRMHTGEKPYECASCLCKFPTKAYLNNHMKTHEKNIKKKKPKSETDIKRRITKLYDNKEIIIDNNGTQNNELFDNNKDGEEIMDINKQLVIDDDNVATNILVVGDIQNRINTNTFHILNDDCDDDMKLVTVDDGGVSIASRVVEGGTVSLYQFDQSLVQIHSTGVQMTISKVTSKMRANF